ncbi:hypothetical protein D3C85_1386140 [compost metagenome]
MDARLVAISFFKTVLPIQPSEFAYINHIYPWHRSWRKHLYSKLLTRTGADPEEKRDRPLSWLNDIKLVRVLGYSLVAGYSGHRASGWGV